MASQENPHAFPVSNDANVNGDTGMTLRDYFAGQFATMPTPHYWRGNDKDPLSDTADGIARRAYRLADAMLAARVSA